MAAEYFNSLGGFSVGIPPVPVVDETGNVVTNVFTPGNVAANVIYASYYRYANGKPIQFDPGGSNTQLQFNNDGALGGIPNVTWNGNILSLGDVSKLSIAGGLNGYFLQTDGSGNLTWAAAGGGGGNGVPGGANTQVQFNDAGTFGGDAGFVYNKDTNTLHVDNLSSGNTTTGNTVNISGTLTVEGNITAAGEIATASDITAAGNLSIAGNIAVAGIVASAGDIATAANVTAGNLVTSGLVVANAFIGDGTQISNVTAVSANTANFVIQPNQPNITGLGTLNSLTVSGNITGSNIQLTGGVAATTLVASGNVSGLYIIGDGSRLVNVSSANLANYVTQPNQANITSLGVLTGLTVDGNISTTENITADSANISNATITGNIVVTGAANLTANLRATGNINFASSPNINLGTLANIRITGGQNGYVLTTNGSGLLSWQAQSGGGNAPAPAGSNTQVQFNNDGIFGASTSFTYDDDARALSVAGKISANSVQIGAGVNHFCTSEVYFARTITDAPNQQLFSIPAEDLAGAEFHIISTDDSIGVRESSKLSCVLYGNAIQFNEYSGLYVNGSTGTYSIQYNESTGTVDLTVTPTTAGPVTYKMLITVFSE